MRSWVWIGLALLTFAGCGDSDGAGSSFSGGTLCEDVCSWPSSCFDQFAPGLGDAECVDACEESLDFVSPGCLEAINAAVLCLGTCEQNDITTADIERCQATVLQIDSAC